MLGYDRGDMITDTTIQKPKRRKLRPSKPRDRTPRPVDKGIPPPELTPKQKYPLALMGVGDSIFVATLLEANALRAYAYKYDKNTPGGFQYRIVTTDPEYDPRGRGWRLFRVL